VLPALADLVDRSGYYGTEGALSDLSAAIRAHSGETVPPGHHRDR
jgi:hypothetical protein